MPPNVDVRLSNTCGRGSWAKIQHKPGGYSVSIVMSRLDTESLFELGDILFSLKPHVATLSNQHLDAYCSNCFGSPPAAGLKRCTRCRIVWYCSLVRSTLFSREYGFFTSPCRHVKPRTGYFTSVNVFLSKSGRSRRRRLSSPSPAMLSDVWAACYGRNGNEGSTAFGYFFSLVCNFTRLSPTNLGKGARRNAIA